MKVKIPKELRVPIWYSGDGINDPLAIDEEEMTADFSRQVAELMDKFNTRFWCENTNHEGKPYDLRKTKLTKDFENEVCLWCEDCREADRDMIKWVSKTAILN